MLNRATRYLPILECIERLREPGCRILDVGSGSLGLGEFCHRTFYGCDLRFESAPVRHMIAVVASVMKLPFPDAAFDIVVASDVFEHIAPDQRCLALTEILRVSGGVVAIGFPSGTEAFAADRSLYHAYKASSLPVPVWLSEHMLYSFPDERLFAGLEGKYRITVIPNEGVGFHLALLKFEMSTAGRLLSRLASRLLPRFGSWLARKYTYQPCYRKILCLERIA